jgi:hypothetical protein
MRKFVFLDTKGLPDSYDAEVIGAPPVVEVKESANSIFVSYHFPGFFHNDCEHEIGKDKRQFLSLEIEGVGSVMDSGKPQLPSFGRYVHIPAGSHYTFTVKTPGDAVQIDGISVSPAQAKMTDDPVNHEVEFDEAAYATDEIYPREIVTVTGPMEIDGYNALLIHVCPFQYKAKSQTLIVHPRVTVTIHLTPGISDFADTDSNQSREAFGNLFLNPRRNVASRVGMLPMPTPLPIPKQAGPQLLIIYAPPYKNAAKRLAIWKNMRGLITEIIEYKADTMSFDSIKTELRNRRSLIWSRLRYVLLLGDSGDIPTQESALHNTTDYYLSTPKDYDATTNPLPTPWLSLGRIPISNAADALSVVDQIIAYEKTPPADASYYNRFVCAGFFETNGSANDGRDYVFTMEKVRNYLISLGYDAERVYTVDRVVDATHPLNYKNGTPVPADVVAATMVANMSVWPPTAPAATQRLVDATTEGHTIIAHRDHGDVDGWYMPPFRVGDLDHVTGNMPSLFYSLNCLTGAFDKTPVAMPECFAEKILRMPGTAPTLVASTELSNTWLNNSMMLGMFDAIYNGMLPTFPGTTASYPIRFNRFGDIVNYARSFVRTTSTDTRSVLGNHEMYHVVGDPSLEVWGYAPRPFSVAAKRVGTNIQVTLSTAAPDCVVTVWYAGNQIMRLTPSGTTVSFPAPPVVLPVPPKPMPILPFITIAAWAPGYRYAETKVSLLLKPIIP